MMTQGDIKILHDYIDGQIDGQIDSECFARLQTLLRGSHEARRMLRDLSAVDAKMYEFAAGDPMTQRLLGLDSQVYHRRFRYWKILALAALLFFAIGLGVLWLVPRGVNVEIVASRDGASSTWPQGGQLRLNELHLTHGSIQMRLTSGVLLDAIAPVTLEMVDPMQIRLLTGHVTIDAGDNGKGFVVDTPQTRVVDLGTRFGVEANSDMKTDVVVFEGAVDLVDRQRDPKNGSVLRRISQGEAARVNSDQELTRIMNVVGSSMTNEWSTDGPPVDCSIAKVTDNFFRDEDWFFYRIIPKGFVPGATAFANRPHTWEAVDGQEFPKSIEGADLVQTFRGARKKERFELQINIARPSTLFIIMPKIGTPAAWLSQDFIRTGDELMVHESDARPWIRLPFEIWKREITAPIVITLGPANRDENGNPTAMYGIAAKSY